MNYQIALDPELRLSTDEFTSAWNGTPDCRALAEARSEEGAESYEVVSVACVLLSIVGAAALAAGKDLLQDELKEKIKRVLRRLLGRDESEPEGGRRLDIVHLERPDGTRVLIVRQIEE